MESRNIPLGDSTQESPINPFDAPVPGQSLTDTPGNYPWEHPPKNTDPSELLETLWDRLTTPRALEEIIAMLDAGVPVEALVRVITFAGFTEGEFTPDVGLIIVEPLMEMITAIGVRAGIKNLRISLEDLDNESFIKDMGKLKYSGKEVGQPKLIEAEEVPQLPNQGMGLLAKPEQTMGEM